MEIRTAIRKFKYGNLNYYVYGGAHDAIVGEWIRWWISVSRRGTVHSVINPAIQARFWGREYYADLLFAEHSKKTDRGKDTDGEEREFFRIVGLAEIENDNSLEKLKHRINSLEAYEKCRDQKHRIKFPDLEFGLLCTYYFGQDFSMKGNEIKKVKNYIKEKSKTSRMTWILYILKKVELDNDYFFKVSGYARDSSRTSFYYDKHFLGKPLCFIFQKGGQLRK